MNHLFKYSVGACLFLITTSWIQQPEKTARLTIELKGMTSSSGKIYVALYRQGDAFPSFSGKYKGVLVDADQKPVQVVFNRIPADTYAVATFHDENNNGVMDKNAFGVPSEIYGFSNNVRKTFSAPTFSDAAFGLESERKLLIHLK
jgi:uncharacterized protein (DUF2141 family)